MKVQTCALGLLLAVLALPVFAQDSGSVQAEMPTTIEVPTAPVEGEQAVLDEAAAAQLTSGEETLATGGEPSAETAMLAHDLSPWGMYLAADWVVKSVMIGLLLASVLTWAIWIFKVLQLHVARHRARSILQILVNAENFADARQYCAEQRGVGLDLLGATAHELQLSAQGPASDDGIKERVAARLDRVQVSAGSHMSRGTGVLATIGAVSPFVGLFGTVWGIMNAFHGLGNVQQATLAMVAPGIAEALIATAMGLFAAIPAVIAYNRYADQVSRIELRYDTFVEELLTILQRHATAPRAGQGVGQSATQSAGQGIVQGGGHGLGAGGAEARA